MRDGINEFIIQNLLGIGGFGIKENKGKGEENHIYIGLREWE